MTTDEDPRTDPAAQPDLDDRERAADDPERDVESDPAYAPDDEELQRLKGA
jgi:hypothetical protein